MTICKIDPVTDRRWESFVQKHSDGGIFHSPSWLEALQRTYGYEPLAYVATTSGGQEIVAGVPFCAIKSRITGRRLVSLPFSDHCQPLADPSTLPDLLSAAKADAIANRLRYVEVRPLHNANGNGALGELIGSSNAVIHRLDLSKTEEQIFKALDKQCTRKISRSEREGLRYEEGRSEDLLRTFYRLLLLTRRRHRIPPQPLAWFRNLVDCLGENLKIRMASKDETPVASIITLTHKRVLTYKYGCSDARFNPLGGTSLLFWRTIQEGIANAAAELDLGRSDLDNPGLIAFKDHWGAQKYDLTYYRHPPAGQASSPGKLHAVAGRLLAVVPDSVFTILGGLLYRHVG
jgi:CelD/BcsL family acetyltransferase involved in cellulose biosynthesis